MLPQVDTKDASAVASFVVARFHEMYPAAGESWLLAVFGEVRGFFTGQHPDYAAVDLRYHDLEHTLQATTCLALLLQGYQGAELTPRITARQFELAMASALLHDSGYLKLRSDRAGTGAKYTLHHVLRSCAFAAAYLPTIGADDLEIDLVLGAISCTGPAREIDHTPFRDPFGRVLASALSTADYISQMAAPDYPNRLEILFNEFRESDEFLHVPVSRRVFNSAADLIERTPDFWQTFVRPRLEVDCQGLYRFLARPCPEGVNPYLEAVERNIAEIKRRIAQPVSQTP